MQTYAPSFPENRLLQPFRRARKGGDHSFDPVHKEGVFDFKLHLICNEKGELQRTLDTQLALF